jgi:hypothetical protein
MKRATLLSIIGLGLAAALVHGQGSIAFDTYNANNGYGIQVTYGNVAFGHQIGDGIDNTFTAVLLYSVTPIADVATTIANIGSNAFGPLNPAWSVGAVGTFDTVPGSAGYIYEPDVNISANVGQTLYFEVLAFQGSAWNQSMWQGHSNSFIATLATGTTLPDPDQLDNMQPFQVFVAIPEPTTLALGGLSLATLFLFRRLPSSDKTVES